MRIRALSIGTLCLLLVIGCTGPRGYYTVRPGDTLYSIAWQYGQGYRDVAGWNAIPSPYTINVGQRLRVLPLSTSTQAIPEPTTKSTVAKKPKPSSSVVSKPIVLKKPTRKPKHQVVTKRAPIKREPDNNRKLYWKWPTQGKLISRFSSKKTGRQGVDIQGARGQSIKAAASGKVVYSGSGLIGYGQLLIIKHNATFLSAYAHNQRLLVKEGEGVSRGQKIAEMGSTGSKRIKLHFEIRKNGKPVNPLWYLPKR